ncbi:hypothetical protein [Lactiplantibacillus brownii]|uniref:hypothetical protein n=1 Tax=Lactiplantibacillus brownii TaxID=3069269 RepID=UPI0038B260FF
MKTSEFKKKFEALNDKYELAVTKSTVYLKYGGSAFGYIEREIQFGVNVNFNQGLPNLKKLYSLATEYAGTPVGDRDPKLYWVHALKTTDDSYLLASDKDKSFYFLGEKDIYGFKAKFTKAEIEQIKQDPKLAIDWDKALEEVKDD